MNTRTRTKTLMVALVAWAAILMMTATTPAHSASVSLSAECDVFYVSVFGLPDGSEVKVRADSTIVFDAIISPYVTWSDSWPTPKRNHRLVVEVRTPDGQRFREVDRVRC